MKRLINGSDDSPADDKMDSDKYAGFVHYELDPSRNYPRLVDDPGLKADKKVFQASVSDVLRNCSWKSKQDAGDFRMRACILFGLPTELADAPTDVLIDELDDVSRATDNLKSEAPFVAREIKVHTFGEKEGDGSDEHDNDSDEVIASPFDSLFSKSPDKRKKGTDDESKDAEYGADDAEHVDDSLADDDLEDEDDNGEMDG